MKSFPKHFPKKRRFWRSWPAVLIIVLVLAGGGYWGVHTWYTRNLSSVSSSTTTVYFTVDSGSTVHQIATNLKQANLIRSSRAFETYVRGRELFNELQAGTYALSRSMTTPQIVAKMVNGEVSHNLLTILPGKTIKQIRQTFKDAGYSDTELDVALNPDTYAGDPIIAYLPAGANLEGMLYPDSFQRESDTPAQDIVKESLDEMYQHLSSDIISGFSAQGLTPYEGITMASIVYAESGDPSSEPTVAQVFLLRLKQGIALGSDVTAFYAADLAGAGKTLGVDSPYNTRLHTGLTPGPIGNFTSTALQAVAHPANTDYLFFVAGDDGTIHFSRTDTQFEQDVKQYCTKECS